MKSGEAVVEELLLDSGELELARLIFNSDEEGSKSGAEGAEMLALSLSSRNRLS